MPALKFRQQVIPAGGFVSNNNFLFGKAVINCPSALGDSTVVSASVAVAGVSNGDTLLITVATGAPSAMLLKSACAIAGGISASWVNSASTDQSASGNASAFYLVFS